MKFSNMGPDIVMQHTDALYEQAGMVSLDGGADSQKVQQ
jgi:hypothetical protein